MNVESHHQGLILRIAASYMSHLFIAARTTPRIVILLKTTMFGQSGNRVVFTLAQFLAIGKISGCIERPGWLIP